VRAAFVVMPAAPSLLSPMPPRTSRPYPVLEKVSRSGEQAELRRHVQHRLPAVGL